MWSPKQLAIIFLFPLFFGLSFGQSSSSSSSEECGSRSRSASEEGNPCLDVCINTFLSAVNQQANGCTEVILEVFCDPNCYPGSHSGSASGSSRDGSGSRSGSRSTSRSSSGSGSSSSEEAANYSFLDISLPCGNLGAYSNSAGFSMEVIANDSVSGITGIRVNGLPNCGNQSSSRSGSGSSDDRSGSRSNSSSRSSSGSHSGSSGSGGALTSFTVTYELCPDSTRCWGGDICGPMVAYGNGPCVQYEMTDEGNQSIAKAPEPQPEAELATFLEQPEAFAFPNPFNESITFEMDLPRSAQVNLVIMDINGKMVKAFTPQTFEPGLHRLIWDGQDAQARPQSDGVYFAKILMGDQVKVIKVILQH